MTTLCVLFDRGWGQSDVTLMPLRVTCHRGWGQNDVTPMLIPVCVTRDRVWGQSDVTVTLLCVSCVTGSALCVTYGNSLVCAAWPW